MENGLKVEDILGDVIPLGDFEFHMLIEEVVGGYCRPEVELVFKVLQ